MQSQRRSASGMLLALAAAMMAAVLIGISGTAMATKTAKQNTAKPSHAFRPFLDCDWCFEPAHLNSKSKNLCKDCLKIDKSLEAPYSYFKDPQRIVKKRKFDLQEIQPVEQTPLESLLMMNKCESCKHNLIDQNDFICDECHSNLKR